MPIGTAAMGAARALAISGQRLEDALGGDGIGHDPHAHRVIDRIGDGAAHGRVGDLTRGFGAKGAGAWIS
jgi:hypothetical protein